MKNSTDDFVEDLIYQTGQPQPILNQYKNPKQEFFICLLPSYIFLIIFLFRYCQILRRNYVNNISHNISLSSLKVCVVLMSFTYLANLILTFLNISTVNLDPNNVRLAFLYIIPILSWYISYKLTSLETTRKAKPACYNQYLFYSISEVAFVYKLISEPQMKVLVIVIDSIQIGINTVTIICFYRCEKKIKEFLLQSDSELSSGYQLEPLLGKSRRSTKEKKSVSVILPKVRVKINEKIQKEKIAPNMIEHEFCIVVNIEGSHPYKVTRSLARFIELERELISYYTLSRFPMLSSYLPILDHHFIEEFCYENNRKESELVEKIQTFLTEIVTKPEFMCEVVLDFLEIHESLKDYFLWYVEKTEVRGSRTGILMRSRTLSLMDLKQIVVDFEDLGLLDIQKLQALDFTVKKIKYYHSEVRNEMMYVFEIERFDENGQSKMKWRIAKSLSDFTLNHRKIEFQVEKQFAEVYKFVSVNINHEAEFSQKFLEETLTGLEKYLKELFANKKLYCAYLLEFLELDPVTFQRCIPGNEIDFLL